MMRRDQLVEALAVLVFFVLVTGLVCWPVPVELGSAVKRRLDAWDASVQELRK